MTATTWKCNSKTDVFFLGHDSLSACPGRCRSQVSRLAKRFLPTVHVKACGSFPVQGKNYPVASKCGPSGGSLAKNHTDQTLCITWLMSQQIVTKVGHATDGYAYAATLLAANVRRLCRQFLGEGNPCQVLTTGRFHAMLRMILPGQ